MKLTYRIKRWRRGDAYGTVEAAYNWFKHEVRARAGASVLASCLALPRGFFAEEQLIYDMGGDNGAHLSDYQHLRVNSSTAWKWLYKH